MEVSLKTVQEQLTLTTSELDKQRVLNEKLETDLLSMNKHGSKPNEVAATDDNAGAAPGDVDILAGLDLGKKSSSVRLGILGLCIKYSFGLILGFSRKNDSNSFYSIC